MLGRVALAIKQAFSHRLLDLGGHFSLDLCIGNRAVECESCHYCPDTRIRPYLHGVLRDLHGQSIAFVADFDTRQQAFMVGVESRRLESWLAFVLCKTQRRKSAAKPNMESHLDHTH